MEEIKKILAAIRTGVNPVTGELFDVSLLSENAQVSREIIKLALSTQKDITYKKKDSNNLLKRDAKTIFDALCEWRREASRTLDLPAYYIFTNKELWAIAEGDVIEKTDLLLVKGIKTRKYEAHGDEVFEILKPFISESDKLILEEALSAEIDNRVETKALEYPHNYLCEVLGLSENEYATTYAQFPDDIEQRVDSVLDGFPDRMSLIVHLKYADSESLQEIGDRFGISKESVSKLIKRSISRIRARKHMAFVIGEIDEQEYIKSILDPQTSTLEPQTKASRNKHNKPLPQLSKEQLDKFPYSSDSAVYISDIVRHLNSLRDKTKERAIKYKDIAAWLVNQGYITETVGEENKKYRDSTPKGQAAGIVSERRIGSDGSEYTVLLCKYGGQRLIVTHYDEIIMISSKEVNAKQSEETALSNRETIQDTELLKELHETKTIENSTNMSCKKCMRYRNETCFGQKNICEDFRNSVDISDYERDCWPDRMQGPYGNLHR